MHCVIVSFATVNVQTTFVIVLSSVCEEVPGYLKTEYFTHVFFISCLQKKHPSPSQCYIWFIKKVNKPSQPSLKMENCGQSPVQYIEIQYKIVP